MIRNCLGAGLTLGLFVDPQQLIADMPQASGRAMRSVEAECLIPDDVGLLLDTITGFTPYSLSRV